MTRQPERRSGLPRVTQQIGVELGQAPGWLHPPLHPMLFCLKTILSCFFLPACPLPVCSPRPTFRLGMEKPKGGGGCCRVQRGATGSVAHAGKTLSSSQERREERRI